MKFKLLRKIKPKAKEKVKEIARGGIMLGYKGVGEPLIKKEYNKIWDECDKVIKGNIDWKTHKYWERTVLGRYFGKNVRGELEGEQAELKDWLHGFVSRLKELKIGKDDRKVITKKFIPFMKDCQQKELMVIMERYGVADF